MDRTSKWVPRLAAMALAGGVGFGGVALAVDTMSTGNRGVEGGVGYSSGNTIGDNAGTGYAPMGDTNASSVGEVQQFEGPNPNAAVAPDSEAAVSDIPFEAADADRDTLLTMQEFNEFRRLHDNLGDRGDTSADWPSFAAMDVDDDNRLSEAEAGAVFE